MPHSEYRTKKRSARNPRSNSAPSLKRGSEQDTQKRTPARQRRQVRDNGRAWLEHLYVDISTCGIERTWSAAAFHEQGTSDQAKRWVANARRVIPARPRFRVRKQGLTRLANPVRSCPAFRLLLFAFCLLPSASCLLPPARLPLDPPFELLGPARLVLPSPDAPRPPAPDHVIRLLFGLARRHLRLAFDQG